MKGDGRIMAFETSNATDGAVKKFALAAPDAA
jgi:hypothetical protein